MTQVYRNAVTIAAQCFKDLCQLNKITILLSTLAFALALTYWDAKKHSYRRHV